MRRAVIAAALLLPALPALAGTQTLKLSDLRQTVGVRAPQISPDGRSVAVLISRGDYDKDRSVGDLTLVDVKTRAHRVLVADGHVSQFEWSPSGDRIAYIATPSSGDEKTPQLFLLPMNGGAPVQLTHEKSGVAAFDWRPDGRALAFVYTPERADAKQIEHHEDAFDETGESWTEQASFDQQSLGTIGVEGGKSHAELGGLTNVAGGIAYAPDGRSIYVTVLKPGAVPSYSKTEVRVVDERSGSVRTIATATSAGSPLRSPDGKYLALLASDGAFNPVAHVEVYDVRTGLRSWTSERLDRGAQNAAFMPDDSIVFSADNVTSPAFFAVDARGAHKLTDARLVVSSPPSVARDGTIAFTASSASRPPELFVMRRGQAPQRVTDYNAWTSRYTLGKHETISWQSHGKTIYGILTYPSNYAALTAGGRKIPLVLDIHGGPTGASNIAFGFDDVLAAHGWLLFAPNYIGSSNEGVGFADAIVPNVLDVAGPSIEDGVAAVLARTAADDHRMGVSGWSAGGWMTSYLITHDTRWKAAVDGAAVDDALQLEYLSDSKGYMQSLAGVDPWAHPSVKQSYLQQSPLTLASRVKTPTLILTDSDDYRVPTPLSYEFYHEIRATGTPVKLVIWPVTGHFPTDPVRREDVLRQWEAWFTDHL